MSQDACGQGDEEGEYYESFERGVPSYFIATRPESLRLSQWHAKHGRYSLRWDWRAGETLTIRHGIGEVERTGGFGCRASFSIWLYMEQPLEAALVFQFREGEKITGAFRFPLRFTGWRQGRPFYHAFPEGRPTSQVDNIRILAPTQPAQGVVFFDLIKYNTLTYGGRAIDPEKEAQWQRPVPDEARFPKPAQLTEAERAGLRKLLGSDRGPGLPEERVQELEARVQALGIVRDEHGIRGGPGIDRHYQYCAKVGEHGAKESQYWPDEHGPGWLGLQTPGPIAGLAYQLAQAYRQSNDEGQRQRLAQAFLLLEEYLYDQGMQAGAGFHWNWWVGESWANAVFLMRDVLAQAGRLQRQCDYMLWNYGGGDLFAEGAPPSHMDYYHLWLRPLLRTCLVQVEPEEQVRWLRAFQRLLERSILQPQSAFKPDGCAYHHGGHYFAYARNAFATLPELLLALSDTPWRLPPAAHERFRRAMLAQRLYCNFRDLPLSLSGRRPFSPSQVIDPRGLDLLARCGTPDGKHAVDPEVAAAYLRFVPADVDKEPYRTLGIKPEPDPEGTFVLPYAALLCHRQDGWLAVVKGQSRYVWGSEREGNVNCFGFFQGAGQLEILAGGQPVNAKDSGREANGWDWRHYEGTTAVLLPPEKLKQAWRAQTFSPETFVGGLAHQTGGGLFAMIVNVALPGGKSLRGRKSWIFSEERILCLGSDIACDEEAAPTITTLCQKRLPQEGQGQPAATIVDGTPLSDFPVERQLSPERSHWLLDVQGTGYLVPKGQQLWLARRLQRNRDYLDLADTEGAFLTAWLDHGRGPTQADYEYLLVVRATREKLEEWMRNPPYRIVQKDHAAHIVWEGAARHWCCVFFEAGPLGPISAGPTVLPLKAIDRPCLLIAEPTPDEQWRFSVADPDLHLENGVSQPQPLRLTFAGAWEISEKRGRLNAWPLPEAETAIRVVSSTPAETIVEISCQHGASYHFLMARE